MVNTSQTRSRQQWRRWWASGAVTSGDPERDRTLRAVARFQLTGQVSQATLEREVALAHQPRGAMRLSEQEISQIIRAFKDVGMIIPVYVQGDVAGLRVGDQAAGVTAWAHTEPERYRFQFTALEPSVQTLHYGLNSRRVAVRLFEASVLSHHPNPTALPPDHDPFVAPGQPGSEDWPEEAFGLIVDDGFCLFFPGSPIGSRLYLLKAMATWSPEREPDAARAA